jgi:alanyl-tRNA synthetase
MYRLVPVVASMMEDFYPYLKPEVDKVTRMVKFEEEKFIRTLITGENLLRKMIGEQKKVTGEDAFKLFDTYGFPIELSQEIALEQNITVDISRFEQLMEEQRVRARSSRSDAQSMHNQSKDLLEFTTPSIFNYNPAIIKAKVIGLFVNGVKVKELTEEGDVVLDTTTFYAESGGQVADQGQLVNETTLLEVRDVKKGPNQQHFHHVSVSYGQVHVGDVLETRIDQVKRQLTAKNHSSLHLLQSSLIQVLGKDVHQQGSFVSHEYGRFDFSYHTKVSETELQQIESIVNRYIEESSPGTIKLMPIEKAKKSGAISPFDEKYGDVVRVVSFGSVSKEFCGGTHVSNTSDIGVFVIVLEESIAAGTRRIVSLTGFKAYEQLKQREKMLAGVRDTLGASSIFEIGDRLKAQISEKVIFQTQISKLMEKQAILSSQSLLVKFKVHNGLEILSSYLPDTSSDSLLKIVDALKSKKPDSIILLIGSSNGSFPIVAFTGLSAQNKGIKANNVVKQVALLLAGSGGGRNDLAFGAGKNLDKIETALKVLEN